MPCAAIVRMTSGRRAGIKRMRVRTERRGHGQGMLSALERLAAELGYVTLHLDPTAGKTAAPRLYEKDSFRKARRGLLSGF